MKISRIHFVTIIPVLLFIISCNNQPARMDSYYFPLKDYLNTKTNCFVNQNDTIDKTYWEMRTYVAGNDTFMETKISDKNGIIEDIIEQISNGVVTIRSYTLYDSDENQIRIACKSRVLDSITFNADQKEGESCRFRLRYKHPYYHDTCEFSRTRTLINVEEDKITFSDKLLAEFDNNSRGYDYKAVMIYAKGKGLVAYKMILPGGEERDYRKISDIAGENKMQ
ncbi:MAG: hypothetical protein M3R17_00635 [Bacteroidota bacterium]|nr:hypothetical protein [Bacteroidota bacterium]